MSEQAQAPTWRIITHNGIRPSTEAGLVCHDPEWAQAHLVVCYGDDEVYEEFGVDREDAPRLLARLNALQRQLSEANAEVTRLRGVLDGNVLLIGRRACEKLQVSPDSIGGNRVVIAIAEALSEARAALAREENP